MNSDPQLKVLQDELAHFSRTIGHPARVEILLEVHRRGKVEEGVKLQIGELSPATVMQHLRELKRAGLIQGRIFGARCSYSVNEEKLQAFWQNSRLFFDLMLAQPHSNG
jgi:ArsR family transcriptional regulator